MNRTRTGCAVVLAAASVFAAPGSAQGQSLGIGDPAPRLQVKSFIKGQSVREFQKNKVYAVEFWATWCGPCRESIPHLTELQKKYPAVTFIGVSVFEQDQSRVAPFVKKMGDQMNYRVALDSVPAGKPGQSGAMATSWMRAAGQDGIPTAFIVDRSGKIAFIGSPGEIENPLSAVLAGKWDNRAAAAKSRRDRELQQELGVLSRKLQAARKDPKATVRILDEAMRKHPELEQQLAAAKFEFLLQSGAAPEAAAFGQRLVEKVYANNWQVLNNIAWSIVDPAARKKQPALMPLGLKAARRADTVARQKQSAVADTLARALFVNHEPVQAVAAEARAIQLAKGRELPQVGGMKKCLAEYQRAASGK